MRHGGLCPRLLSKGSQIVVYLVHMHSEGPEASQVPGILAPIVQTSGMLVEQIERYMSSIRTEERCFWPIPYRSTVSFLDGVTSHNRTAGQAHASVAT